MVTHPYDIHIVDISHKSKSKSKSKSNSKKTLFNVGQCKQYNISSHLKWVLVADKPTHISDIDHIVSISPPRTICYTVGMVKSSVCDSKYANLS